MFKVGDKVRRIKDSHCGMNTGDVAVITVVRGDVLLGFKEPEFNKNSYTGNQVLHDASNFELVQEHKMNKPHKHAELIKAWADGKQIQVKINDADTWGDTSDPRWLPEFDYRIKPEPKPDVVRYAFVDKWSCGGFSNEIHPQMSIDNVSFTFDGETGKLKHVELLEQKS